MRKSALYQAVKGSLSIMFKNVIRDIELY